jgi:hypothetical protein
VGKRKKKKRERHLEETVPREKEGTRGTLTIIDEVAVMNL